MQLIDAFLTSSITVLRTFAPWLLIPIIGFSAPAPGAETAATGSTYSNRLSGSNNPYLLLHADNPVDWYPWGPEAIARARSENKPIFLSVGYSTCYWCHVAERTLYSNPEIARLMNQWFVNIKVDREQRPDVDQIYIVAQQLIAGTGGWPNNVFLTPDLKPFFAGSYFPPVTDARSLGFPQILENIHRAWTTSRPDILDYAETVHTAMQQLQAANGTGNAATPVTPAKWLERARRIALERFDNRHGGFVTTGRTTKFPESPTLQLLLADYKLHGGEKVLGVLISTLDAMAYGGIRDHIGGGFHRYSTDSAWSVPHFEKMLYDNAQLLHVYAEAFRITGRPLYRQVAQNIGDYLVKQMMAPEGGFYTAHDAQVDGVEGASYLWRRDEIEAALGKASASEFFAVYELTPVDSARLPESQGRRTPDGARPGVLRVRLPAANTLASAGYLDAAAMLKSLERSRAKLLAARNTRPQPMRDEKINVDLNGLAIEAFVTAGTILELPAYVEHARRAAEHIWTTAFDSTHRRLMHQIYNGQSGTEGFLADYALLGRALLTLHDATGDPVWRERATILAEVTADLFLEADGAVRMWSGRSDLPLVAQEAGDEVYPSGTSAAIELWLRLAAKAESAEFTDTAERVLRGSAARIARRPDAWAAAVAAVNTPEARNIIAGFAIDPGRQSARAATDNRSQSPGTSNHVRIASAVRESVTRVELTLEIDEGYHVNANPATYEYLIPTVLSFEGTDPLRITYPESVPFKPSFADKAIDVYEHRPVMVATFGANTLEKPQSLRGTVTVQACNDEVCLPPSALPFSIRLRDP